MVWISSGAVSCKKRMADVQLRAEEPYMSAGHTHKRKFINDAPIIFLHLSLWYQYYTMHYPHLWKRNCGGQLA